MRVSELIAIRLRDIDRERDTIRILCKHDRQRQVVIPHGGPKQAVRTDIRTHHETWDDQNRLPKAAGKPALKTSATSR